jgi:GT2 family glycosyltransferase
MISIIIVSYKSYAAICKIIDDLSECVDIEIFIVDNGGEFSTKLENTKNVFILNPGRNLGFAAGVNYGLKHVTSRASSNYIMVMNPDVTIETIAIKRMSEILSELPLRTILSCETRYKNGIRYNCLMRSGLRTRYLLEREQLIKSDLFNGCLFMVNGAIVREVSLNEDLFMYFEEVDFVLSHPDFTCYFTREAECVREHNPSDRSFSASFHSVKNIKILIKSYDEIKIIDCAIFVVSIFVRAMKSLIIKRDISLLKALLLGIYSWRKI